MSQTYIAVIVMVLGALLPKLGVQIGNDGLTTFVSVAATIIGALWALVRRYKAGDITLFGARKF